MVSSPNNLREELQLLWRAVRTERFRFIIVQYNHYDLVRQVITGLSDRYPDRPQYRFDFLEGIPRDFPHNLLQYSRGFILLEHFELLFDPEHKPELVALNQRRDAFSEKDTIILFFLPAESSYLQDFAKYLPDLYSVVSPVIQLEQAPALPGMTEWDQGRGYASGTEAEADLMRIRSRLEELPDQAEYESLRASLYLDEGRAYQVLGLYEEAANSLRQSLTYWQKIGDLNGESVTMNSLGEIYFVRGDYDTALDYLHKSLRISQQTGNLQAEGATRNNLATIAQAKGDYETALTHLQQALQLSQKSGDRQGEGAVLNNISQICEAKGSYEEALHYLQHSLKIRQEIGDRKGEGATLNNMGTMAYARGDFHVALSYFERALQVREGIGDRQGEGVTLNNISLIYREKSDFTSALTVLQKSLSIQQEIGDRHGLAVTLHNIGMVFYEQEHFTDAVTHFFQAYQIFDKIGSPNAETSMKYLQNISERIGEQKVKAIIGQLTQSETS